MDPIISRPRLQPLEPNGSSELVWVSSSLASLLLVLLFFIRRLLFCCVVPSYRRYDAKPQFHFCLQTPGSNFIASVPQSPGVTPPNTQSGRPNEIALRPVKVECRYVNHQW